MLGIVWGMITGQTAAVNDALIEGGKAAVELCIGMAGVVGAWCGLMEIAKRSGIEAALSKCLHPIGRFLFPRIPEGHPAMNAICLNLTANILGLGWAATPAGLVAMKELKTLKDELKSDETLKDELKLGETLKGEGKEESSKDSKLEKRKIEKRKSEKHKLEKQKLENQTNPDTASDEMCTFLVINISSLQLIPVNMIAYRSSCGSAAPAAIVGPGILATLASTAAAVLICLIFIRFPRSHQAGNEQHKYRSRKRETGSG